MTWQLRDPWCLGYLGLAVLLGVGIGTSGAAWLSTVTVLAAMVLGVLRPAASMVWAAALVLLVLTATVLGVITGERAVESAALASSSALAHAAAIALPVGLVALVRRTRRHRRQGWELASAIAATESARAESALVRERSVMAGEIHDHLGHRLTLLTVQVGRLTLDPDLPESTRAALAEVRGGLAEAASELGATVQLLGQGSMPTRAPADRSPAEVVERARSAGVRVEGDLPPRWEEELSAPARSAAVRVLSEGAGQRGQARPGTGGAPGGLERRRRGHPGARHRAGRSGWGRAGSCRSRRCRTGPGRSGRANRAVPCPVFWARAPDAAAPGVAAGRRPGRRGG